MNYGKINNQYVSKGFDKLSPNGFIQYFPKPDKPEPKKLKSA